MTPFTVEHFEPWAYELELDNGERWRVERYFLDFLEDYFAGVTENWLIVPEGNAKTTNLAGLAVYILENRPNANIPWAASSRDQAEIGYRQAEGFVLRSTRLRQIVEVPSPKGKKNLEVPLLVCQEGYRRIRNSVTGGRLQVFAADDGTGDGIIPTDAIIDELHRHKNLRLYRTWRGKLGKRGGQLATISTAGEPGTEFEATRERIRQETPIVDQRSGYVHCRSERIAFHEYAVPEGGDVEDMPTVKLANPFSGITEESLSAKYSSPTMTMQHWRRFVCNLATRGDNAAITEAEWFAAKVDEAIPEGKPIDVGLDVAWKWDTTAIVPLYWKAPDFRLLGPATILTPPRDGSMLSSDEVEAALIAVHRRNPIVTVVMDISRAEQLAQWIESEIGAEVIERTQSNAQAVEDYDRFMEALRSGWLKHTGEPGLTRHVLNAVAKLLPQGDTRFDRTSTTRQGGDQERRVIDGLTAASMVHFVASESALRPAGIGVGYIPYDPD